MNAISRTFMADTSAEDDYAALTSPDTLTLRRRLAGPIDRVWAHVTESDLRRRWLASGDMELKAGATFELTWRNDDLTVPAGKRPEGFPGVHTSEHQIVAVTPNDLLAFSFGNFGTVTIRVESGADDVLLTLVHRGLKDRATLGFIAPSWHNHLDLLAARLAGRVPEEAYWDKMARLQTEYDLRLPR